MENKNEFLFHPKNVMLFLLLAGLSFLFLALTVSYIYIRVTNDVPPVKLPLLFLFNTVILLGSSRTMMLARKAYMDDQTLKYQHYLLRTMQLSLAFTLSQCVAWWLLFNDNILLSSSTTTAFLYVISFTHLAHVLVGLPFLYLFYRTAKKYMIDPVTVLVYFSDPEKRLKLRLLTIYWHFLDLLWIYLVLFFGINMFV
ncbi:MAG: heme-copper oxidase subunit III [Bacteroidota bacterium]|jgi:cytochrome c oxidase subunit 3